MSRQVLRYRSSHGTGPYASAIFALMKLARETEADFEFGPVGTERMFIEGLTVTGGSMEELDPVTSILGTIPHLHRTGDWLE